MLKTCLSLVFFWFQRSLLATSRLLGRKYKYKYD